MNTKLVYLYDMAKLDCTAKVVGIETTPEGKDALILDQTVFYPQGGGQPYDTGTITGPSEDSVFDVSEVRIKEGIVWHIGSFRNVGSGSFAVGQEVHLQVNSQRRELNSRLHSAGHLIDAAMRSIGLSLIAGKGYHYPLGAYNEYESAILEDKREEIRGKLEAECNRMIAAGFPVRIVDTTKDKVAELCGSCPDYLKDGSPVRVVFVANGMGCPCGGTHVADVKEIGRIAISKIAVKSGRTRVSYSVSPS